MSYLVEFTVEWKPNQSSATVTVFFRANEAIRALMLIMDIPEIPGTLAARLCCSLLASGTLAWPVMDLAAYHMHSSNWPRMLCWLRPSCGQSSGG